MDGILWRGYVEIVQPTGVQDKLHKAALPKKF